MWMSLFSDFKHNFLHRNVKNTLKSLMTNNSIFYHFFKFFMLWASQLEFQVQ